ncbi:MAG TPA: TetR/AcrR family transcriptional regulator [Thermoleophilaceae bacterium]|nr:TetR/AcrR family transcriptional regulator [Thermoleophilaceae bacterium]
MPKVVDHEQRREELAAAVWRIASRQGLDAVTIRGVAAEAGWSTGALHHYFSDKEELLLFAFQTVAERVNRRVAAARHAAGDSLELTRALLEIGLPLDEQRREETRVWFAFLGLALTRPPLARAQRLAYEAWRRLVADALRGAQAEGDIDEGVDVEREAAGLVALVDGLAVQAMFEPTGPSAERQLELVDARLAELRDGAPAR